MTNCHHRFAQWRLQELLCEHPGLRIKPSGKDIVVIVGSLRFSAEKPDFERINDEYDIEIVVPNEFPNQLPYVWETGDRIPKSYHKLVDGSLCLGSPARIRMAVSSAPTLPEFVRLCVIPYLYGFSFQSRNQPLPFGELAHGVNGLINDYADLFGITDDETVLEMIYLASLNKRDANRQTCPCGSGKRLGKCHNRRVNEIRKHLGRKWLSEEYRLMSLLRLRAVQSR